jgi:foldase protein PrsA
MANFVYRSLACSAAAFAATLALSACGGGTTHHDATQSASVSDSKPVATPTTAPVSEPNAVVVRVGGHAITKAQFVHALHEEETSVGRNVPVPPDFTACIARLKAILARSGESGPKSSVAQLKKECMAEYKTLEKNALDTLIIDQWVIGGAAEEKITVSQGELEQEVRKIEKGRSQAQMTQELATTGQTLAGWEFQVKVDMLANGIRHLLANKTAHPTQAQIARYYKENKTLFGVPERRELEIVLAASKSRALKAKEELAAGKTFASVAASLPEQPSFSKAGLITGYEPDLYHQAPLNNAIMAAKPHVLSGPVGIFLGYYVFEVKRIIPAVQKPLAQVRDTIQQELPLMLYRQALAAFVKAWRMRWAARTDCRPGYVIANCRQFGPPEATDLYTLN